MCITVPTSSSFGRGARLQGRRASLSIRVRQRKREDPPTHFTRGECLRAVQWRPPFFPLQRPLLLLPRFLLSFYCIFFFILFLVLSFFFLSLCRSIYSICRMIPSICFFSRADDSNPNFTFLKVAEYSKLLSELYKL